MRKLTLTSAFIVGSLLLTSCNETVSTQEVSIPTTTPSRVTVVITQPATTTTTTTTTTTMPDLSGVDFTSLARSTYGKCGEWHDLALSVGWSESEWPTLSRILYRESRCTPLAFNGHDAGLVQINQIHTNWASQMGMEWPDDLFDPENNLLFAYRLWSGREDNGQCGWQPWSIKCA